MAFGSIPSSPFNISDVWEGVIPPFAVGDGSSGTHTNTIHIPGHHPDFASLLGGDPYLQGLEGSYAASQAASAAARRDAIRRAYINFGDPSLNFSDVYGDIDQTTRDAAAQAGNSGVSLSARLAHQHTLNLGGLHGSLASRGILSSGEANLDQNEEDTRYKGAENDAIQQVLSLISGANTSFAQDAAGFQTQRAQAILDAANRLAQDPANASTPDVDAHYDTASGYYKDPYGNLYDSDGTLHAQAGTY